MTMKQYSVTRVYCVKAQSEGDARLLLALRGGEGADVTLEFESVRKTPTVLMVDEGWSGAFKGAIRDLVLGPKEPVRPQARTQARP